VKDPAGPIVVGSETGGSPADPEAGSAGLTVAVGEPLEPARGSDGLTIATIATILLGASRTGSDSRLG